MLDDIALRVSQCLQHAGAKALPIPASQLLDKTNWRSYISHKAVAVAAGVGWQGKSLLVVNPEHGPRIRLVTILTDASLDADKPIKNKCGKCPACSKACPAQAIKNVNTDWHYSDRNEALHFERCLDKVSRSTQSCPLLRALFAVSALRSVRGVRKRNAADPRVLERMVQHISFAPGQPA